MKTVTSAEAKARLKVILAEVEATGEPVTITNHGRPVAIISPGQSKPRTFGQFPNLSVPLASMTRYRPVSSQHGTDRRDVVHPLPFLMSSRAPSE